MKRRLYKKAKKRRIREAEAEVIKAAIRFTKFTGGPVGIYQALRDLVEAQR